MASDRVGPAPPGLPVRLLAGLVRGRRGDELLEDLADEYAERRAGADASAPISGTGLSWCDRP
jgi:hypothetical protein